MPEKQTVRKGFFLYLDMYEPVAGMSDAQLGQLLRAMFAWHNGEELECTDPMVRLAFGFFAASFEREKQKYSDICEKRRTAAKKRWDANDASASNLMQTASTPADDNANDANSASAFFAMHTMPKQDPEPDQEQDLNLNPPHPPLGGDGAGGDLCSHTEPEPEPGQNAKPKQKRKSTGNTLPELRQVIHAFTKHEPLRTALEDFRAMRERLRKPLTGKALELILQDLEKLAPDNPALQVEIVNQSVKNSWQGVFALKGPERVSFAPMGNSAGGMTLTERNAAVAAEVLAARQKWRQEHEQL